MFKRIFSPRTPAYSPLLAPSLRSPTDPPSEKHEKEASEGSVDDYPIIPTLRHQIRSAWPGITFHVVFLAINTILLMISISRIAQSSNINHSPTAMISDPGFTMQKIDFHTIYQDHGILSTAKKIREFTGTPRPELKRAWRDLQRFSNIRVTEEELGQFATHKNLVRLSDGSGAYGMLAVYHGLHCVERMHHILYTEHYYPNLTEHEAFLLLEHSEHCLDYLRQYVQCNADTTLVPMYWPSETHKPAAVDTGEHQCVSWDGIVDWASKHTFDPKTPGLLVHPKFGNPYVPNPNASHYDLGIE